MQNYSIHTHSIGYDGKNTIHDMVQRAKMLGWSMLGISNHMVCHKNMPLFHKMFYSDINLLKELNKNNVSLIISDDAHSCDELGQYFHIAEDILDKIQYKNILNTNMLNLKKLYNTI